MSVESKINSLITAANAKTGKTDADLTSAMQSLVDGYGGGGGSAPPAVAVAQFPVTASLPSGSLGSLTIDFAGLQAYMSATKTYAWTLILWRSSQATEATSQYVANSFSICGRVSQGNSIDANDCRLTRTPLDAMTSNVQLNVWDFKQSRTASGTALTINTSMSNVDCVGDYIGIFTLLPPYSDAYTGDKLTDCPDGFLTLAAATSTQSNDAPPEEPEEVPT